jgi:hypothetical protein
LIRIRDWLFAPWNKLGLSRVSRKMRAILVGGAVSLLVLNLGSLLFEGNPKLKGRSIIGVLFSPDEVQIGADAPGKMRIVENSPSCREFTNGEIPKSEYRGVAGRCINWRTSAEGQLCARFPELSTCRTTLKTTFWQGDLRLDSPPTKAFFRGNSRDDGYRTLGDELIDFGSQIATWIGVILAIMLGASIATSIYQRNPD